MGEIDLDALEKLARECVVIGAQVNPSTEDALKYTKFVSGAPQTIISLVEEIRSLRLRLEKVRGLFTGDYSSLYEYDGFREAYATAVDDVLGDLLEALDGKGATLKLLDSTGSTSKE